MKKRWMAVLLVLCMVLATAACGGGQNAGTDTGNEPGGEQTGGNQESDGNQQSGDTPGNEGEGTPPPEQENVEPATISFVLASTTDNAPYLKIFEEFEKQTPHTVELQPLPGGAEYDNMIKTRFSTEIFPI